MTHDLSPRAAHSCEDGACESWDSLGELVRANEDVSRLRDGKKVKPCDRSLVPRRVLVRWLAGG